MDDSADQMDWKLTTPPEAQKQSKRLARKFDEFALGEEVVMDRVQEASLHSIHHVPPTPTPPPPPSAQPPPPPPTARPVDPYDERGRSWPGRVLQVLATSAAIVAVPVIKLVTAACEGAARRGRFYYRRRRQIRRTCITAVKSGCNTAKRRIVYIAYEVAMGHRYITPPQVRLYRSFAHRYPVPQLPSTMQGIESDTQGPDEYMMSGALQTSGEPFENSAYIALHANPASVQENLDAGMQSTAYSTSPNTSSTTQHNNVENHDGTMNAARSTIDEQQAILNSFQSSSSANQDELTSPHLKDGSFANTNGQQNQAIASDGDESISSDDSEDIPDSSEDEQYSSEPQVYEYENNIMDNIACRQLQAVYEEFKGKYKNLSNRKVMSNYSTNYAEHDASDFSKILESDRSQTLQPDCSEDIEADHSEIIEPDHSEAIESDRSQVLESDRSEDVEADHSEIVEPDHSEAIESDHSQVLESDRSQNLQSDRSEDIEADHSEAIELDRSQVLEPEHARAVEPEHSQVPELDLSEPSETPATLHEITPPTDFDVQQSSPSTTHLARIPAPKPSRRKNVMFFESPTTGRPVTETKKFILGESMDFPSSSSPYSEDSSSSIGSGGLQHDSPTMNEQAEASAKYSTNSGYGTSPCLYQPYFDSVAQHQEFETVTSSSRTPEPAGRSQDVAQNHKEAVLADNVNKRDVSRLNLQRSQAPSYDISPSSSGLTPDLNKSNLHNPLYTTPVTPESASYGNNRSWTPEGSPSPAARAFFEHSKKNSSESHTHIPKPSHIGSHMKEDISVEGEPLDRTNNDTSPSILEGMTSLTSKDSSHSIDEGNAQLVVEAAHQVLESDASNTENVVEHVETDIAMSDSPASDPEHVASSTASHYPETDIAMPDSPTSDPEHVASSTASRSPGISTIFTRLRVSNRRNTRQKSPTEQTGRVGKATINAAEKARKAKKEADEKARKAKKEADEKARKAKKEADEKARNAKEEADEKARKAKEEADEKACEEKEQEEERLRKATRRIPKEKVIQPLTAEWESKVKAALDTADMQQVLVTLPSGTKLTRKDLGTVKVVRGRDPAHGWLNDEIILAALEQVVEYGLRTSGHEAGKTPTHHVFNTFFYKNLRDKGAQSIKRWATKAKIGGKALEQVERILIPVHQGAHWTLLVVSPTARTIEYFDSMGGHAEPYIRNAKLWLAQEMGKAWKEEEWSVPTGTQGAGPRQTNGSDCGVFTCTTARMVVLGVDPMAYGGEDMGTQRGRIVAELLNGGLRGEFEPAVVF